MGKMIELDRIRTIFNKLSIEESLSIRRILFDEIDKKGANFLSNKIFELILSQKEVNENEICNALYGKVNLIALKKLLQRFTDKVIDILVSKEFLVIDEIYDVRSKNVFIIRKKLLLYDVLAIHGVTNYALLILNQVIALSKKIEYYDYLLISLEKKLVKMTLSSGEGNFNRVYMDILHYSDCNSALKNCIYLLRLYSSSYEYKQEVFSDSKLLLAIKKVKGDYKRTKSKSIKIYIFYLEGIYYYNIKNFRKCIANFKLLFKYLNSNGNIVHNSYFVSCLINISEIDTMLYNFEKSLACLYKVIHQFSRNEYNDKLIREMIFLNYFYLGDIRKAAESIKILQDVKLRDLISPFLTAKRNYYLAVMYTINGLFNDSNKILSNCLPLFKDKTGWNIGVRLLSIINNIELEKFMFVESEIENLRKHISRIKKENEFYSRLLIISKILNNLISHSFNYQVVAKKYEILFEKISSNNSTQRWMIKSPEMLIFHEWFDAKVKGIPYNHPEVMKRLRKNNLKKKNK